jgi:APA family basic amino acid/polyamine antiporter
MKGVFSASSIVFFSYIGFDYISNAAEEAKNPKRDLPLSIIGSLVVATVLSVLMSFTMVLMVPFGDINIDSPFSSGFISLDMKIASFVVSVGALCGILTSTMTGLLSQTRLLVVLGREHFLPPALARVSSITNTPLIATFCTGLCSGLLALLVNISFLAELVSAGTLYIFFLTCLGILFKRYKKVNCNPVRRILGILACVCTSSVLMSASYLLGAPWFIIVLMSSIWLASLLSARLFLEADLADSVSGNNFQVPFFPFLPALGVLFTIHLMCSLSWLAFVEYCIFMMIGLAVYVFYSSARVDQREIELNKQRQRHSQETIGLINERDTEQAAIQLAETSST